MIQREIINELQQIVSLTDGSPEAAQRAKGLIREVESWPPWPWSPRNEPVDTPQQPTEPAPPAERHIDTPDELLELLAGISSDPQVEGLSLSQKASTMALLHIAKALQESVKAQHDAMAYLMDKTATSIAPQPIRIFSKHSRRRHAFRSAVYDAAAANDLARRIVNRADTEATCEEKTVDIALMIREAFGGLVEPPPQPAETDAADQQEPS